MSSLLQSLSALIQGRQNNRILRLSFPHDDGPQAQLLVNKLDAVEYLSRDFEFTVDLLSDDSGLALKDLQGRLFCVELVRADGSLRYFSGFCLEFRSVRTDGAITFYQAKLGPWLQYLRARKDNYIFHDKTLQQQLESIFADYGTLPNWDFRVRTEDAVMTDATQFAESDHNYFHRRLESNGWLYFYEHSAQGHKLIITDDSTRAGPIDGGPEIRFQRHGGATEEDGIGEFSAMRKFVAGSVSSGGFNFKQPVPIHAGVPTLNKQGNVPSLEVYDYLGAYGVKNTQDADKVSRQQMEAIEATGKHFEAIGNNRFVIPGCWFRLTNHFAFNSSGSREERAKSEFLILSVHHVATNNYLQEATEKTDYSNTLTCIRRAIPWRPARDFNSVNTKILGPQTATVVGIKGQGSIFTDEYSRTRVQFHWDRVGNFDENSSAWIRSASTWAGSQLGFNAAQRAGMEVVVIYLDGNPDRPLIIGSVYNQSNMPPWKLATEQSLMGIRSRELTPDGGNQAGGRSNHLVLDDTENKIQAQLKSDHLHSSLSLGYITRIEDNIGRKDPRGEGFCLETNGAGALRGERGLLLSTDGRARAVGGILSRDELISCLEQALDIAKGLGQAAAEHQGGQRDPKPQQDLTAAIDALGHGAGNEADAKGPTAGGQPVMAFSSPGGIASATPQDQTHYAGQNIDTVAGKNQQHYAIGDILHTAKKNIEQFAIDGDIRQIANKGKLIHQAQNNTMELTADQSLTVTSTHDQILLQAQKAIMMQVGSSFIRMTENQITIDAKTVKLQSDAPSFVGSVGGTPAGMADVNKITGLDMKRDLEVHYLDAEGNPLKNEPINMHFSDDARKAVSLDEAGRATIKDAQFGQLKTEQPRRQ